MLKRGHYHPHAVRWTRPRLGFGAQNSPGNPPEARATKHHPATKLIAQNDMV
jgi:hypothetical protein